MRILAWNWQTRKRIRFLIKFMCSILFDLSLWSKGKNGGLRFRIPMIWWEPKYHSDVWYFCSFYVYQHNRKNQTLISYPANILSVKCLILHESISLYRFFKKILMWWKQMEDISEVSPPNDIKSIKMPLVFFKSFNFANLYNFYEAFLLFNVNRSEKLSLMMSNLPKLYTGCFTTRLTNLH